MTTDDPHDRYAYSHRALARLVLAAEARELADSAAAAVRTASDGYARPGEHIEHARQLVTQAQAVLEAAVIHERTSGASWETVGQALGGISRQSAHTRYAAAEDRWRVALVTPLPDADSDGLPWPAYQPTAAGRALDRWLIEHNHRLDPDDPHPVTGHLPPLTTAAELSALLDAIAHAHTTRPADEELAVLLDRKAALLDRIAAEDGEPTAAEAAAGARARAAEIRAQSDHR